MSSSSNIFIIRESSNSTDRPRVKVKSSTPVSLEEAREFVKAFVEHEETVLRGAEQDYLIDIPAEDAGDDIDNHREFLQIAAAKRKIHESEPDIDTGYLNKLKIFCGFSKPTSSSRQKSKATTEPEGEEESESIGVKKEEYPNAAVKEEEQDIDNAKSRAAGESNKKAKRKRESTDPTTEEKREKKKLKKAKKEKKSKKDKREKKQKKKKHKK